MPKSARLKGTNLRHDISDWFRENYKVKMADHAIHIEHRQTGELMETVPDTKSLFAWAVTNFTTMGRPQ